MCSSIFLSIFSTGFLLFLSIFVFTDALRAIDNSLSSDDNTRLKQVFLDGFNSNDLQSNYFGALNLKELTAQEKNSACSRLVSLHSESKLNVSFSLFIWFFFILFIFWNHNMLSPFHRRSSSVISIWLVLANCLNAKILCQSQFCPQSKHHLRKTQQLHMNCITISIQINMPEIQWMKQQRLELQLTYKTFWRPMIRWASKKLTLCIDTH